MATEITMPQLGESVTEGTITKWLVEPGAKVNKYDPIAEVMTDKVSAEIPSSYAGTIGELLVHEDDTISVGTAICTIEVSDKAEAGGVNEEVRVSTPMQHSDQPLEEEASQKKRFSPAVLKLAQEHGVNLETLSGSGRGGRITRKDVQKAIEEGATNQYQASSTSSDHRQKEDLEIPLSGIRKAIAANLVKSKEEAPHAWTMVEVDVTSLVQFRNRHKHDFKVKEGINLTFMPFFIKAIVDALKEFPQLNSKWAGDKIIQKKDINISLAVASDEVLFVPVIKHADEKSIKALAREVQELAHKGRKGELKSSDMQGGTFTVNNTGSFGSIQSAPILNQSQAAILSVESIVKRPVVIESETGDSIAIRSMVNLCLSLDHRVLDGLICGRFLARVKESLENMREGTISLY